MAQHKIEYWMTDVSVMETEILDDKASCQARWQVLCTPPTRAWATNVYHKDENGDWQSGLET